jgi:AAA domain-containing protein
VREKSLVIAVEGASGAGKSTIVARTAAEFDWVPLAEAYDRIHPTPDLRFSSQRELLELEGTLLEEEARRFRAARALQARGRTVIADTGFLGPLTYTWGLARLGLASSAVLEPLVTRARRWAERGRWGLPDGTAYLVLPAAVRRGRASRDPVRHPPDLQERHEAVGREERRFYRALLPGVLPGRVREVRSGAPLDEVVRNLQRAVQPVRPLRGSSRVVRSVLRLLR